ncbi:posphoenolpyruvate synthetase regulatory kinase/phosphorylase PpsR [Methylobacillus pratensis]
MQKRSVFFISDGTGITAESVGHLLAHFPTVSFKHIRLPFTNSEQKVEEALVKIADTEKADGARPIVVMTLVNTDLRDMLKQSNAVHLDVFGSFVDPLAEELQEQPSRTSGIAHSVLGNSYYERIDAINFTLNHDDGMTDFGLSEAQVILVGVSRCGKTPTSLYLAMQFGIKAANYPLIPEDLERGTLPEALKKHPEKLYGLSINPERLHSVRSERRPDSHYASLDNCRHEIRLAEDLMQRESISWIDSTSRSIEELSTIILQKIRVNSNH